MYLLSWPQVGYIHLSNWVRLAMLSVTVFSRRFLLEQLLNLAGRDPNVRLLFKHKLLRANLEQGEVVCSNGKDQQTLAGFKAILGCDGAFSRLRQDVVRRGKFYFEQKYIEHGYVELCIPAKVT